MDERDDWSSFSWYCPNCGGLVTGYKNREGFIKVECGTCHSIMVRRLKNHRHNNIDIFTPIGIVEMTV
ncbi:MAG: hypothetical protein LUI14_11415 [Lachnospiraceae bacterium]|nr:hypothetical protein [Lachnospiraceae bacterium]MCD7763779.1 hypothetical protein [Lachnospiraceae bacterium]